MTTRHSDKKYLIWKSNQYLCFGALPGIIGAGGVYPLIFVFAASIYLILENGMPSILVLIGSIFLSCLLGYFVGIYAAMVTGTLAIYFLNGLNSLLGNLFEVRWIVGASGSLTGYVIPAAVMIASEEANTLVFFLLGPFLGMLLGFLGAISYLDSHYADQANKQTASTQPKLQFKIIHILFATAISAVVIAIAQISENMMFAFLCGFWVIIQPIIAMMYLCLARVFKPLFAVLLRF